MLMEYPESRFLTCILAVEMEFDARELKKRGEELFHSAVRSLLDENPEQKTHVQHALEELLTTQQEPIKRMVG